MAAILNFNRIRLLLQRYFVEDRNRILYFWAFFIIFFMFFRNNTVAVGLTIVVAGATFCGRFFKEIHSPTAGLNYFMIPATQSEKITVSLFLTIVYFFGMMMVTYAIGNLAGTFLNNLFADVGFLSSGIDLFTQKPLRWCLFESSNINMVNGMKTNFEEGPYVWQYFKAFLFVQAIFTLGSLYFKRSAIFKTILTLFIVSIVCAIIAGFLAKSILGISSNTSFDISITGGTPFETVPGIIAYLLIPYLWITGYFKLTEKEV